MRKYPYIQLSFLTIFLCITPHFISINNKFCIFAEMKYLEFKNQIKDFPIIFSEQIGFFTKEIQSTRNQISRWKNSGLLIKLRKGMYLLNENDRKLNPSLFFLANTIYAPSYISLEYALQFYGLIPERVVDVTSVSTLKTKKFINSSGVFVYRKIKQECFRGFTELKDNLSNSFLIALPEKTVIDFLYLNLSTFGENVSEIFYESYRFQNTEQLKTKLLREYAELFKSKKLNQIVAILFKQKKND